MVANPELILADEPTGNLDFDLTMHLMDIFKQFHTYGTSVIMATHSKEVLECVPNARIINLQDGRITPDGEAEYEDDFDEDYDDDYESDTLTEDLL